jgi:3-phenylpropionate/trans-cinnamate dioxygenase ferredoxin component
MGEWVKIAALSSLLPGEYVLGDVDGTPVAVYNIDGALYAIEDVCTHDGGELAGGEIIGTSVECVRHGARFDLVTGAALCAPAHAPTTVMDVKVLDQTVWVRDPRF